MSAKKKADESSKRELETVLECLQNDLDFEILMYFIIYRELTLSKIEELIPHKSRPTAYRHIQNLLEAGFIFEAREEKVRGHIKAKIYQLAPNALNLFPQLTLEEINAMSREEKDRTYQTIRKAMYPTIHFMENLLEKMSSYLQILKPLPEKELLETFDQQDFHLNMNFFSEKQHQLYLSEFQKFMQTFVPKLLEEEKNNPEAKRTYAYIHGLLPIRKMLDRIMEEKAQEVED